jgi:hypothetical protein
VHSNCFLSGTDVQTQLAWQRYTDAKDCPWLAIVVRECLRTLYVVWCIVCVLGWDRASARWDQWDTKTYDNHPPP